MTRLSARVQAIAPSPTLAVSARATALKARGVDVIGFGAGEPDFDTPLHIRRAAEVAVAAGATRYTAVAGTMTLRAAVAADLAPIHGLPLSPENVIVTVGAKHALHNLFLALLEPGDEVVLPIPCWTSYPELIRMAGGTAGPLPTHPDEEYRIDEARLAALVSPRTRAIVLVSHSNPTGAVYDAATLEIVARVVRDRGGPDTCVITDDIYRRLVYEGGYVSITQVAPELRDRTIFVDGVSKTYAMTGWRIGFCAGPKDLIGALTNLQSQSTTHAAAVSQAAALAAITGPQDCVEEMRREFAARRRIMCDRLRRIPEVRLAEPHGAFYAFPDLSAYLRGPLTDDVALCEHLLEHGGVALVPGSAFLAPGFVRLSYATSLAHIEEGLRRLERTLAGLG